MTDFNARYFIDDIMECNDNSCYKVVYHDRDNVQDIVTNGQFIAVFHNETIPVELDCKCTDTKDNLVEVNYLQWDAMLDNIGTFKVMDLTKEDIQIICKHYRTPSFSVARVMTCVKVEDYTLNYYLLDKINMFMSFFPESKLFYDPKSRYIKVQDMHDVENYLITSTMPNISKHFYDKTDRRVKPIC